MTIEFVKTPTSLVFCGNRVIFSVRISNIDTEAERIPRMLLRVSNTADDENYIYADTDNYAITEGGEVEFDISSILQQWVKQSLTYPEEFIISKKTGYLADFQVEAVASYLDINNQLATQAFSDQIQYDYTAIGGGVSQRMRVQLAALGSTVAEYFNNHPLTVGGNDRLVSQDMPLYLYVYSSGVTKVRMELLFGDNVVATDDINTATTDVWQIACSPAFLAQYFGVELNDFTSIRATLYDDATALSSNTWSIISQDLPLNKYFIYLNSVGGWDTMWMDGQEGIGFAGGAIEFTSPLPSEVSYNNVGKGKLRTPYEKVYSKSSGYINGKDKVMIMDFLQSTTVYLVDGSTLVPIVIKPDSADIKPANDYAHLFTFEYSEAFNDDFLGSDLTSLLEAGGDYSNDYSNDFNIIS